MSGQVEQEMNDQRMVNVGLLEVFTKAFSQQVRAFRNTATGEVKHVLLNSECDDPSWEDVVVLPDVSNEDQDKLRAIIGGPGVEPVATVADAYDCNGLHWHCEQPPEDGALLYLAAPSAPAQETIEVAREFFAWANKTWPCPSNNESHPWNRLGTLLGDQPMKSFDSLFDGSDAHLLETEYSSAPVQAVPDGWQLVPKEPTEEMVQALKDGSDTGDDGEDLKRTVYDYIRLEYKAMLAAAPQPPKQIVPPTQTTEEK